MNLDELKDKLVSQGRASWEKIQDSSAFGQIRDHYENLTPSMQKLAVLGSITLIALLILSVPLSNFNQSSNSVDEFEGKRETIRELLKVSHESSEIPNIQQAPPAAALRSRIDEEIKMAQLMPEQNKGINSSASRSQLIPENLTESTLEIKLNKLNLRQVIDLGTKFQSISSSVKLKDLIVTANMEDGRFLDVVYQLVALAVPTAPAPPPEEPQQKEKGNRNKKQPSNKDAEE